MLRNQLELHQVKTAGQFVGVAVGFEAGNFAEIVDFFRSNTVHTERDHALTWSSPLSAGSVKAYVKVTVGVIERSCLGNESAMPSQGSFSAQCTWKVGGYAEGSSKVVV